MRKNQNGEAAAYNEAAHQAAKQGRTDSAELFFMLAVDEETAAERAAGGTGRNSGRRSVQRG